MRFAVCLSVVAHAVSVMMVGKVDVSVTCDVSGTVGIVLVLVSGLLTVSGFLLVSVDCCSGLSCSTMLLSLSMVCALLSLVFVMSRLKSGWTVKLVSELFMMVGLIVE